MVNKYYSEDELKTLVGTAFDCMLDRLKVSENSRGDLKEKLSEAVFGNIIYYDFSNHAESRSKTYIKSGEYRGNLSIRAIRSDDMRKAIRSVLESSESMFPKNGQLPEEVHLIIDLFTNSKNKGELVGKIMNLKPQNPSVDLNYKDTNPAQEVSTDSEEDTIKTDVVPDSFEQVDEPEEESLPDIVDMDDRAEAEKRRGTTQRLEAVKPEEDINEVQVITPPQSEPEEQTQEELAEELYNAARRGDVEAVKQAFEKGAKPDPIIVAVPIYNGEIVRLFVENGLNADTINPHSGYTLLMRAAKRGDEETVELLLEHGADPNIQANDENTALLRAIKSGNEEVVELLLKSGANPNKEDLRTNPLLLALEEKKHLIAELLLVYKADVNYKFERGSDSVLAFAIMNKLELEELKFLIEKGADINSSRFPILYYVAYDGTPEIAEYLIGLGADPKLKNKDGKTALEVAEEEKNTAVAEFLRNYMAENESGAEDVESGELPILEESDVEIEPEPTLEIEDQDVGEDVGGVEEEPSYETESPPTIPDMKKPKEERVVEITLTKSKLILGTVVFTAWTVISALTGALIGSSGGVEEKTNQTVKEQAETPEPEKPEEQVDYKVEITAYFDKLNLKSKDGQTESKRVADVLERLGYNLGNKSDKEVYNALQDFDKEYLKASDEDLAEMTESKDKNKKAIAIQLLWNRTNKGKEIQGDALYGKNTKKMLKKLKKGKNTKGLFALELDKKTFRPNFNEFKMGSKRYNTMVAKNKGIPKIRNNC
ncbi:ankyrin repeat domain-containing protein [Candidatus Micrarchaeota archaeon]|nr:ankyrin repeat domain-containing protein [Candidatus Micrarchaeota archaeon]